MNIGGKVLKKSGKDKCDFECEGYELTALAISIAFAIAKDLTNLQREVLGSIFFTMGNVLHSIGGNNIIFGVMCEEKLNNNNDNNIIIEGEESST